MIRFFVFISGLVLLTLIAALVAPPFIDWNQYSERFEAEASRVLGLPVSVDGEAQVQFLPKPTVSFSNLKVGEVTSGGESVPVLTVREFRMEVQIAPLLKGEIVIADILLRGARGELRLNDKGRLMWPKRNPAKPTIAGMDLNLESENIALQNVRIEEGALRLRDGRNKQEFIVADIFGKASAITLAGPWQAEGTVAHLGKKYRMRGSTGRWQPTDQMSLKLRVEPQDLGYDFTFDGPFKIEDDIPSWSGLATVLPMAEQSGEDRIVFPRNLAELPLPVRLESDFRLLSGGATVPAFKLDIGSREDPYTVTGTAQALFGDRMSFRINAEGQQIDLERLQESMAGTDGASNDNQAVAGLNARLAVLRDAIGKIPRFSADGAISLFLPAVVFDNTTIREIGLDVSPKADGDGWRVRNLEAQLPGRTEFRADGELLIDGDMRWLGDITVASRQPSGLAAWLGGNVPDAVREMAGTGFAGLADISSSGFAIDDLELVLDGKVLRGSVSRKINGGDDDQFGLALNGKDANLDQLNAFAQVLGQSPTSADFKARALDVAIKAELATLAGVSARGVDFQLKRQANQLLVERLQIGDIAGAQLDVTGTIDAVSKEGQGPLGGQLVGTIKAANPLPLLRLLDKRLAGFSAPPYVFDDAVLTENTELQFSLSRDAATAGGGVLVMNGTVGGSEIDVSLNGIFAKPGETQPIALAAPSAIKLVVVNDDASVLLAQLGAPVLPVAQTGRGAFRLNARKNGQNVYETDAAITLREGYVSAGGTLSADGNATPFGVSGSLNVVAEASNLDPIILMSGLPVPGYGDGLPVKLKTMVVLEGASLGLKNIQLALGESNITGSLDVKPQTKPRAVVTGNLRADVVDASRVLEMVHGSINSGALARQAESDGDEPERLSGGNSILLGLDGTLELSAGRIEFPAQVTPLMDFASKAILQNGDLQLTGFSTNWAQGVLSGNLEAAQASAAGTLSGQLELSGAQLANLAEEAGFGLAISGLATVQLGFETANTGPGSLIKNMTGGGSVRTSNLKIEGLNAEAFKSILGSIDGLDDKVVDAAAPRIVQDTVSRRAFVANDTQTSFSIGAGTLRANAIRLDHSQSQFFAKLQGDLNEARVELEGRLVFDPGLERVAGAKPEIGIRATGTPGNLDIVRDTTAMETYLGLRVSERRERAFESQKAEILERQRLQRESRIYALKEEAARKLRELQEREAEQRRLEDERRRQEAQEEARKQAEAEAARRAAEQEAAERERAEQQRLEEERKLREAQAEKLRLEIQEAKRKAAEQAAAQEQEKQQRLEELRRAAEEALQRYGAQRENNALTPEPDG